MGYGEVFFSDFFVVAPGVKSNTTLRCMPLVLFSFLLKASSSPRHTKSSYVKQNIHQNRTRICKVLSRCDVSTKKGLFHLRQAQGLKKRFRQTVSPEKLTSRILRCSHPLVPIATLRLKLIQMFLKETTISSH